MTSHSLYQRIRRYRVSEAERQVAEDQNAELRWCKAELRRVAEERDILKKAAAYFANTSECGTRLLESSKLITLCADCAK